VKVGAIRTRSRCASPPPRPRLRCDGGEDPAPGVRFHGGAGAAHPRELADHPSGGSRRRTRRAPFPPRRSDPAAERRENRCGSPAPPGGAGRTNRSACRTTTSAFFSDAPVFTASSLVQRLATTRAVPVDGWHAVLVFIIPFKGELLLLQHLLDHLRVCLPPALLHHLPDEKERSRPSRPDTPRPLSGSREDLVDEKIQRGGVGNLGQTPLVPKRAERLPLDRTSSTSFLEAVAEIVPAPDPRPRGRSSPGRASRRGWRLSNGRIRSRSSSDSRRRSPRTPRRNPPAPGPTRDPRVVPRDPVLPLESRDLFLRQLGDRPAQLLDPRSLDDQREKSGSGKYR